MRWIVLVFVCVWQVGKALVASQDHWLVHWEAHPEASSTRPASTAQESQKNVLTKSPCHPSPLTTLEGWSSERHWQLRVLSQNVCRAGVFLQRLTDPAPPHSYLFPGPTLSGEVGRASILLWCLRVTVYPSKGAVAEANQGRSPFCPCWLKEGNPAEMSAFLLCGQVPVHHEQRRFITPGSKEGFGKPSVESWAFIN